MSLTKQQWVDVKQTLSRPYGTVYLRCDGYLVAAQVQTSKMKLVISVYVDGFIKGECHWSGKESAAGDMNEIARRFWFWKKLKRPAKQIRSYEKIWGKRECKKRGVYEAQIYTVPCFAAPATFIAHIKRHNQTIEILDYDAYKAELDKKMEEDNG